MSTPFTNHLSALRLQEPFHSADRKAHSTKSAILHVHNDILRDLDEGYSVGLVLLELIAAFDTVNPRILYTRLEHSFGVRGQALLWFQSYLQPRTKCVNIHGVQSDPQPLSCGKPQGSVLGSVLFSHIQLTTREYTEIT